MDAVLQWVEQGWLSSQPALNWLAGPFWTFLNAPFIAGLVPAIVGLLLTKRVAEVAETNKDAAAVRAAEVQVQEIDRAQEAFDLRTTVDEISVPPAQEAPVPQSPPGTPQAEGLSDIVVAQLEEKIEIIKLQLRDMIGQLDGRKKRKYENVSRYDYRPIALMLARDGALTDEDAYKLVEIFSVWTSHRLKKPLLPQEKADLILGFRLPRKFKRSRLPDSGAQQATAPADDASSNQTDTSKPSASSETSN